MEKVAAGLVGGVLGTGVMMLSQRAGKLPKRLQPPKPRQDPGEYLVSHAEKLVGRRLPRGAHQAAVKSMPWVYGSFWPLSMAALADRLGVRRPRTALAAGALLGAAVWSVGMLGWLPATRLLPPVSRQKPGAVVLSLLGHIVYGTVAALPLALSKR